MPENNTEFEELKQLMQELFVADLKTKADELREGISTDYTLAIRKFKEGFEEIYNDKYAELNKPDIDRINNLFIEFCKKCSAISGLVENLGNNIKQSNDLIYNVPSEVNSYLMPNIKGSISEEIEKLKTGIAENVQQTENNFISRIKHQEDIISAMQKEVQKIKLTSALSLFILIISVLYFLIV